VTKKILAGLLQVEQPSIAKMKKRNELYLFTLCIHIEAMGRRLEVVARSPDGAVKICSFAEHGREG
jgi:hypothetical protein